MHSVCGARFRGGGRAKVPLLPADDSLTSDGNNVYFTSTSEASPQTDES